MSFILDNWKYNHPDRNLLTHPYLDSVIISFLKWNLSKCVLSRIRVERIGRPNRIMNLFTELNRANHLRVDQEVIFKYKDFHALVTFWKTSSGLYKCAEILAAVSSHW